MTTATEALAPIALISGKPRVEETTQPHSKLNGHFSTLSLVPNPLTSDQWTLPCEDNEPMKNFFEHPQTIVLTESLTPVLRKLRPNRDFLIGQDCAIYWHKNPPRCEIPDWFCAFGLFFDIKELGRFRRSYIFYEDGISPEFIFELASDDGDEERDQTPYIPNLTNPKLSQWPGKMETFEKFIKGRNYLVFIEKHSALEYYRLIHDVGYVKIIPDANGRYFIPELRVSFGIWHGELFEHNGCWVRAWDAQGNLLPVDGERADNAEVLVGQEKKRADDEQKRADDEKKRADDEKKRADDAAALIGQEKKRADDAAAQADVFRRQLEMLKQQLLGMGVDASQVLANMPKIPNQETSTSE